MEKNAKIGTLFYKERNRTQRSERSFIKNGKERNDRNVLLKRTDAQPWILSGCVGSCHACPALSTLLAWGSWDIAGHNSQYCLQSDTKLTLLWTPHQSLTKKASSRFCWQNSNLNSLSCKFIRYVSSVVEYLTVKEAGFEYSIYVFQ